MAAEEQNPTVVNEAKKSFDAQAEKEREDKISSLVDEIVGLGATDIIVINRVSVQRDDGAIGSEQKLLFNTINVEAAAPLYAKVDYFANLSINLAQHFNEQRSVLFRKEKIVSLPADELMKLANENQEMRKRLNLAPNEPLFDENNNPNNPSQENGPKIEEDSPVTEKVQ